MTIKSSLYSVTRLLLAMIFPSLLTIITLIRLTCLACSMYSHIVWLNHSNLYIDHLLACVVWDALCPVYL